MIGGDKKAAPAGLASPGEIAEWVRTNASSPERIYSIKMLCSPETPTSSICVVDTQSEYASALAAQLRGQTFGYSMVIVSCELPAGFSCRGRPGIGQHCSCHAD